MAFAPAWPREPGVRFSRAAAPRAQASDGLSSATRRSHLFDLRLASISLGRSNRRNVSRPNPNSTAFIVTRAAPPMRSFAVFTRTNRRRDAPRLGLSIAARIIGNAVRRNRIKRLVRESFRQHQHELPARRHRGQCTHRRARRGQRCDRAQPRKTLACRDQAMRLVLKALAPRLSLRDQPAARTELPLLSELLVLRRRSDRTAWRAARRATSTAASLPALSSLASRRLRPRAAAHYQ